MSNDNDGGTVIPFEPALYTAPFTLDALNNGQARQIMDEISAYLSQRTARLTPDDALTLVSSATFEWLCDRMNGPTGPVRLFATIADLAVEEEPEPPLPAA